jgi:hypothetical protein
MVNESGCSWQNMPEDFSAISFHGNLVEVKNMDARNHLNTEKSAELYLH